MTESTGKIFKNEEKRGKSSPEYRGRILIDGKEVGLNLYVKRDKFGVHWFDVICTK